jgi:hypothetical protein
MSLSNLIRRKSDPAGVATATLATFATLEREKGRTVASVATVAVAKSGQGQTVPPAKQEPFDREAFEERAAICEFDGGLDRDEAEAVAWIEDDRRRCAHCLNLRDGGFCAVAEPGGLVSARRGYKPDPAMLQRCAGYRPCLDDPDRRMGMERWPGI